MAKTMDEARLRATFSALTAEDGEGHPPFRWQMRLLHRLLDADPPPFLDIPTGLGKTSAMALWLIAIAEGAELPRRLVYIVDRRAVVDQATRFAERLRGNMLSELAERLDLDPSVGLPVSTLRGSFTDNRDWLEDPSKPAIVVGTIDMVGSRLLFEGYGVSRRMRPYHAGLLSVDALVLLDEAHLCPPFEALLRQVESRGEGRLGPMGGPDSTTPPFRLMSLSATGRNEAPTQPEALFSLEAKDRGETEIEQRLSARKLLKVEKLPAGANLARDLAERAVAVGCTRPFSRVLVYCHHRSDAVEVKTMIDRACGRRKRSGDHAEEHRSELLVGERRVRERVGLEAWLDEQGFLGAARQPASAPTFLVATSAGEVGVDLNADHMVCDLVAYERMVQRLGRVNRRGGAHRRAVIDVLALPPALKAKAPKEAKEKAHRDFEAWLAPLDLLPPAEDGRRDASPANVVAVKTDHPDIVRAASTPAPLHPELTRPLLDAWAMTSLKQHEGRPEIAPWLRGWEDDEPQTTVVWRKHLPCVRTDGETSVPSSMVGEYFRVAPVHTTERLEAASTRVFDWMLKRSAKLAKRPEAHDLAIRDDEIVVILIDRAGEHRAHLSLRELQRLAAPAKSFSLREDLRRRDRRKREWRDRNLPGAVMIVDFRFCGVRDGMLDENSESAAATADADEDWRRIPAPMAHGSRPLIGFRVEGVDGEQTEPSAHDEWRHIRTFETRFDARGAPTSRLYVFKWPDDPNDEDARSVLSSPQTLRDHAEQVARHTRALAQRLGLPKEETDALVTAARMHDDGKAAERWQNAMNAPRDDGRPYAKTKGGGNPRLLEGYRHEFGSLLKAEGAKFPDDMRDLILHLIAAHHGYARPIISPAGCEDGPPSMLEAKAGDAARRFARLQKRYGPWGLAWREAILRAADQSASREWSERNQESPDG